jgi:serine/threonine protein phosphatase PrpC
MQTGELYITSQIGRRPTNEDAEKIIINLDGRNSKINKINYYGLFDGHNSKLISAYLKDNLDKFLFEKRVTYPLNKDYTNNVFDYLQKMIKEKLPCSQHAGSTALAVVHYKNEMNEDYLNVMNVGDSRCLLCRDNFAIPLNKDHKPNWPEEHYRIKQLGGKIVFDGYDYRIKDLSVSRAFGDIDATPYVTHRPELFRYKLNKGDKFMAIFCDGLVEAFNNNDIVNFILLNCYEADMKTRKNKEINIAEKLALAAIKRGSGDNVSVIIVFFDKIK